MDYVFDWARDLYRPSILHLLGCLSDIAVDDQASLAADSDIFSSRQTVYDNDIPESYSDLSPDAFCQTSAAGEELLKGWQKYDILGFRNGSKRDMLTFRPACVVKYVFECLYITRDNFRTLLASLGINPAAHKTKARAALTALRQSPLKTTDRTLSQMEDTWTGTPRFNPNIPTSQNLFVSVALHTIMSNCWEIHKVLTCFAIDQDALDTMRKLSELKSNASTLSGLESSAPLLDESTLAKLLNEYRGRSVVENIAFAFSNRTEEMGPPLPLPRQALVVNGPLGGLVGNIVPRNRQWRTQSLGNDLPISIHILMANGSSSVRKIVVDTYKAHKQPSMLQPDYPYLRFSSRFEETSTCTGIGLPESAKRLIPDRIRGLDSGYFLVCDVSRSQWQLCLYFTNHDVDEPQPHKLLSAIRECIDKNYFAVLDRKSGIRSSASLLFERGSLPLNFGVDPKENKLPILRNAARHWHRKLRQSVQQELLEGSDDVSDDEPAQVRRDFISTPFASVIQVKRKRSSAPDPWRGPSQQPTRPRLLPPGPPRLRQGQPFQSPEPPLQQHQSPFGVRKSIEATEPDKLKEKIS